MKIRINHNNNNLWCLYSKESIEIGERFVEISENYLDEEIIKTYKYIYLGMLVDNYIENYDEEPEIFGEEQ